MPEHTAHKLLNSAEQCTSLARQLEILQAEICELDTKLKVAYGMTHVQDYERTLQVVEAHVQCQKHLQAEIGNAKLDVQNLKSQLTRLERTELETAQIAVSDLQYTARLNKARTGLENVESRLMAAKQREGRINADNNHLQTLIHTMLHDRVLFNKAWSQMIKQLQHDRGFLVDMIERSILAFNQQESAVYKIEALQQRADKDFKDHVGQMVHMRRELAADELYQGFVGVKGKRRKIAALEEREVHRRKLVKRATGSKFDLYTRIIEKVFDRFLDPDAAEPTAAREASTQLSLERLPGELDVEFERRQMARRIESEKRAMQRKMMWNLHTVIDSYVRNEANHFSQFKHLSHVSHLIEMISHQLERIHLKIDRNRMKQRVEREFTGSELQYCAKEIEWQRKETQRKQGEWRGAEASLHAHLNMVNEMFSTLGCDRRLITSLLGNHNQVTTFNIKLFLSSLENCINSVLGRIYYNEARNGVPDANRLVRVPVKTRSAPIQVSGVVRNQQCSECAERDDVNRYDETVFYPNRMENTRQQVKDKVVTSEIQYRLHTLSQCRLPRSRLLVNERYK